MTPARVPDLDQLRRIVATTCRTCPGVRTLGLAPNLVAALSRSLPSGAPEPATFLGLPFYTNPEMKPGSVVFLTHAARVVAIGQVREIYAFEDPHEPALPREPAI